MMRAYAWVCLLHALSEEKRRVSSVLLGLEGSEPHANSPFNIKHDASGASKEMPVTPGDTFLPLCVHT
eukprot:4006604-Amphidinium_carterae.1